MISNAFHIFNHHFFNDALRLDSTKVCGVLCQSLCGAAGGHFVGNQWGYPKMEQLDGNGDIMGI
jgi:hypothetical protein